jgi:hypothetical protein
MSRSRNIVSTFSMSCLQQHPSRRGQRLASFEAIFASVFVEVVPYFINIPKRHEILFSDMMIGIFAKMKIMNRKK